MNAHTIHLRQYGEFLGSRALGEDARSLVERTSETADRIIIDFGTVDGISISFADELFGKLAEQWGLDRLRALIQLENCNAGIGRMIQFAIRTRIKGKRAG